MSELKYQEEIKKIECDLNGFSEQDRVAFRWTFEDINDQRNFLPRFLLKPDMERNDCRGWGLSFFNTQDSAKKRLKEIVGYRKNLYKKLGTHVATGNLEGTDGISDNSHTMVRYGLSSSFAKVIDLFPEDFNFCLLKVKTAHRKYSFDLTFIGIAGSDVGDRKSSPLFNWAI